MYPHREGGKKKKNTDNRQRGKNQLGKYSIGGKNILVVQKTKKYSNYG